ncbi:hypothetical protein NDU88_003131, partial [Pleurodeles waltl]
MSVCLAAEMTSLMYSSDVCLLHSLQGFYSQVRLVLADSPSGSLASRCIFWLPDSADWLFFFTCVVLS